jgi:hypothetical protein
MQNMHKNMQNMSNDTKTIFVHDTCKICKKIYVKYVIQKQYAEYALPTLLMGEGLGTRTARKPGRGAADQTVGPSNGGGLSDSDYVRRGESPATDPQAAPGRAGAPSASCTPTTYY